jgi:hypothetical protein
MTDRAEIEVGWGGGRRRDRGRNTSGMAWMGSQPVVPDIGGAELVRKEAGKGLEENGPAAVGQLLHSQRNGVVVWIISFYGGVQQEVGLKDGGISVLRGDRGNGGGGGVRQGWRWRHQHGGSRVK